MQARTEGDVLFLKLEKGEDVLATLRSAIEKEGIKSGEILWAIGMIRHLEVGYFNGKEYEKHTFEKPLEVVSFHGSIAQNEPVFHIHASCAGQDHVVVGGHLFSGTADPLLEVHIRRFSTIKVTRQDNPKTGLKEISLS